MIEEKVIVKLEAECKMLGVELLETPPSDYTAFRQIIGYHAGLRRAINLINEELKRNDEL